MISGFAVTYRRRSGAAPLAGREDGAEYRRRSALRNGRCTGTAGASAETEAVVVNAVAGSWWSGRSRTSMTPGLRRVWVRDHEQVRKRVLIQAAGCNLGLLLRDRIGVSTPPGRQGRALPAIPGLIGL